MWLTDENGHLKYTGFFIILSSPLEGRGRWAQISHPLVYSPNASTAGPGQTGVRSRQLSLSVPSTGAIPAASQGERAGNRADTPIQALQHQCLNPCTKCPPKL